MLIYFCSTLECAQLDSRVIYRRVRKTLGFKSVRKIFRIVSKPDHTHGKLVSEGYMYILFSDQYICKNPNISDTQIEWGRAGGGHRAIKPVLFRFLNDRRDPKSTLESSDLLFFGVRLCWEARGGGGRGTATQNA